MTVSFEASQNKKKSIFDIIKDLRLYITYSDDDGMTWQAPAPIPGITNPKWGWFATGPPGALQLSSGRIVVPSYYTFQYFETNMNSTLFIVWALLSSYFPFLLSYIFLYDLDL